jgi:hypothetical protein
MAKNISFSTKSILKAFEILGGLALIAMPPGSRTIGRSQARAMRYIEKKMLENEIGVQSAKDRKKFKNKFYYLKKNGLINIEYRGKQIYVSLTEEGQKKAGKYKINELKIKAAKNWDKKWRILIFDIEDKHKGKREALRGKIKELGLYQLQKSVWVCPYEFKKEMVLLREFFGLENDQMKVITASEIEDDEPIRNFFGVN